MLSAARYALALLVLLGAPASAAEGVDVSAWIGSWTLDAQRSDPPGRLLDALEMPWFARAAAKAFTPRFTLEARGGGLSMRTKTPLGTRTQPLPADGSERQGSDHFDRTFRETSQWASPGVLVVERATNLPSGAVLHLRSKWRLDGATLRNEIEATVGSEPPFGLRRTFVRDDSP